MLRGQREADGGEHGVVDGRGELDGDDAVDRRDVRDRDAQRGAAAGAREDVDVRLAGLAGGAHGEDALAARARRLVHLREAQREVVRGGRSRAGRSVFVHVFARVFARVFAGDAGRARIVVGWERL